jgi:hypothetical protein
MGRVTFALQSIVLSPGELLKAPLAPQSLRILVDFRLVYCYIFLGTALFIGGSVLSVHCLRIGSMRAAPFFDN